MTPRRCFIAGGNDHILPPAVQHENYKKNAKHSEAKCWLGHAKEPRRYRGPDATSSPTRSGAPIRSYDPCSRRAVATSQALVTVPAALQVSWSPVLASLVFACGGRLTQAARAYLFGDERKARETASDLAGGDQQRSRS
jgi:hypothetical protein